MVLLRFVTITAQYCMDSSDRLFNHSYACHHNDDVKRFEAHPLGPSLLADRRVPDFCENCWHRGRHNPAGMLNQWHVSKINELLSPLLLSKVPIPISLPGHSCIGWFAGSAALVLNGNTMQVYFSFTKLGDPSRHRSAVHSIMNHNHWWNSSSGIVAEKHDCESIRLNFNNVEGAAKNAAVESLLSFLEGPKRPPWFRLNQLAKQNHRHRGGCRTDVESISEQHKATLKQQYISDYRACGKGCTNSNETFFPLHPMMSMFLATSSCPGVASKADASMARLLRGASPRHADDPCCSHIFVSHCSYRQVLTNTDFELLHDLNMKSPFLMLNLAFWAETVKQTREIPVNQEAAIVKPEAKNWESEVPWIHPGFIVHYHAYHAGGRPPFGFWHTCMCQCKQCKQFVVV